MHLKSMCMPFSSIYLPIVSSFSVDLQKAEKPSLHPMVDTDYIEELIDFTIFPTSAALSSLFPTSGLFNSIHTVTVASPLDTDGRVSIMLYLTLCMVLFSMDSGN